MVGDIKNKSLLRIPASTGQPSPGRPGPSKPSCASPLASRGSPLKVGTDFLRGLTSGATRRFPGRPRQQSVPPCPPCSARARGGGRSWGCRWHPQRPRGQEAPQVGGRSQRCCGKRTSANPRQTRARQPRRLRGIHLHHRRGKAEPHRQVRRGQGIYPKHRRGLQGKAGNP